ncbi:MAG: ABC transporter permease [Bacteroidales bacterium]|nr:ABC transporter permease [Bacteroidales bacterium]
MKFFYLLGEYLLLMRQVFRRPEKFKIFYQNMVREADAIGIDSLWIVSILSIFMGAIATIQMAFNIDTPLIPSYTIGFATRQTIILEFSPTMISLILAGKIGSKIASEIGTMKVTDQIDALEIMGVNSANYLILPKIAAAMFVHPLLIIISIALALFGGWVVGTTGGLVTSHDYIYGIQAWFQVFDVIYAMIKTVVFAFIITSISGFFGYSTTGGARDVGNSSTKAVVYSSIFIILFNLIITQLLLHD